MRATAVHDCVIAGNETAVLASVGGSSSKFGRSECAGRASSLSEPH